LICFSYLRLATFAYVYHARKLIFLFLLIIGSVSATSSFKPLSHQQQCRSNIVECYKSNNSFDKVECCFDERCCWCRRGFTGI